jgi:hypothetical protein
MQNEKPMNIEEMSLEQKQKTLIDASIELYHLRKIRGSAEFRVKRYDDFIGRATFLRKKGADKLVRAHKRLNAAKDLVKSCTVDIVELESTVQKLLA